MGDCANLWNSIFSNRILRQGEGEWWGVSSGVTACQRWLHDDLLGLRGPCWALTCPFLPLQACRDFLDLAETHSRKWQRALQYEREQRIRLEETIEQLAKQHNSLERACRGAPGLSSTSTGITSTAKGERRRDRDWGWVPLTGAEPHGTSRDGRGLSAHLLPASR